MRRLVPFCALLFLGHCSSTQKPQEKAFQDQPPPVPAMGSCNCVCKQGTSRCMPSFADACNATICGQSACGTAEQVDTLKTSFSSGSCPFTPMPGDYATLATHVRSIGHQGARIWTGQGNNGLLSGESLRASLLGATNNSNLLESHPEVAQAVS